MHNLPVQNVILIISDTFRRDNLSCYGGMQVRTPHLDRFAERALIFNDAFSGSFPTVPCRNDIMTGRYTFTYKPWSPLGSDEVTLSELLRPAEVLTGLIADTPHPFTPGFNYQRGFQSWEIIRGQEGDPWKSHPRELTLPCDPGKLRGGQGTTSQYLRNVYGRRSERDYFPAQTMQKAAEWIEHSHDTPFFLYVDTFDPHEPWDPPKHYVDLYDPGYEGEEVIYPRYDRINYLTSEELRHCRALYAAEATMVDHWIGYFLDRIESLGLFENTAVIFMADHGFYLGDHGFIGKSIIRDRQQQTLPLLPEVCHIPLLISLPGGGSRHVNGLVQPVDLMPTILELFDVDVPSRVQGKSLLPLLNGPADLVRELAVASPTISGAQVKAPHPTSRVSVTDGEWMLVCGSQASPDELNERTSAVDSIGRAIQILEPALLQPALYHLKLDPTCLEDRLASHPAIAAALHRGFLELIEAAGVPPAHLAHFRALA